jgi:hypothetical protein
MREIVRTWIMLVSSHLKILVRRRELASPPHRWQCRTPHGAMTGHAEQCEGPLWVDRPSLFVR